MARLRCKISPIKTRLLMLISSLLYGFLPYFWRPVIGLWGLGESNALEVASQLQTKETFNI